MDSLSYQMLKMSAACTVTYDKTDLISDLGKTGSDTKNDDFQKLMDKAASGTGRDTRTEDAPKSEAPAEKKEDSLARVKKMLEQNGNAVAFKPDWTWEKIDLNTGETIATYNPGEWVMVFTSEEWKTSPSPIWSPGSRLSSTSSCWIPTPSTYPTPRWTPC